jgi:hypothetical protein
MRDPDRYTLHARAARRRRGGGGGGPNLPVVRQKLDRCAAAISKHKDRSVEWLDRQPGAAHSAQTVNSSAEISRLDGNQDPHLRRELHHGCVLPNACTSTQVDLAVHLDSHSIAVPPDQFNRGWME